MLSTTIHELGHMSHWNLIGPAHYAQTSIKIYESWAEAVKWALTNDEYHQLGQKFNNQAALNYNCTYTNQFTWPIVDETEYSPIFIDLIDNQNQRVINGGDIRFPNDLISGYNMLYLQNNILVKSYGYSSLLASVRNHKIPGVTDDQINQLFALYF